ncbi:DUF2243 domain-containing protein [Sphingobium sp. EP60837]|uniref:DUF2243 domain-containing protein n=1 Tax=Sphingobium sp. EP60837 TaxID=1855519 RepID=UPI0007DD058D|nr:DUF2243 domain-containing protein [Sphingobium sp. EP60837]ANI80440.1 hypothetical protein EP837_04062 [Sphingobium sp. EP60837]
MPKPMPKPNRSWSRWGIVLGFALGGFFDGILLHQILQWHHLLSLVPGVETIRGQVLWDGYFHALMYVIAVVGLWGLWRARTQVQEQWGRALIGALLIGFGLWHIVDSVLSHWLLGIHRIKLDSPNPLMWDLIWFTVFGLVPLIVGWLLLRNRGAPPARMGGATMAVLLVGLATAGLGAWSLRPPPGQKYTTVVFAPGVRPADAMNAIVAADARLAWADPKMAVVVVEVDADKRMSFYRRGALLVGGSGLPSGCFSWSRA